MTQSRSVTIHLGMPKTATTTCQNALWQYRRSLWRQGILYPGPEANHTNALCTMFLDDPRRHITVRMRGITRRDQAEAARALAFAQMERALARRGWRHLILSAEGLSNLSAEALSALADWLSGHVDSLRAVYWLRHPVTFSASVVQQLLKNGARIRDVLSGPPLANYRARIENARAAFGPAVEVHRFEDALSHPGGPVAAFCAVMGVPPDLGRAIAAKAGRDNPAMSMRAAHTLDALNAICPLISAGQRNPARNGQEMATLLQWDGPRFDLTPTQKARIRAAAREDERWLTQEFGRPFYPDLFEDTPFAPVAPAPGWATARALAQDLISNQPRRGSFHPLIKRLETVIGAGKLGGQSGIGADFGRDGRGGGDLVNGGTFCRHQAQTGRAEGRPEIPALGQ